jgi:hypothetical protein
MRLSLPLVTAVIAVLAVGCGRSASPTSPAFFESGVSTGSVPRADVGVATTSAHAAHAIPFKGTLDGTVTITPLEPPIANVFIAATGNATHLGQFSVEIPHVVNFATAIGEGTYTFIAANGDRLTANFTGTADTTTPIFAIVEHATITGGTGRFSNATGSFTVRRLYDVALGTTSGSVEGTIAF